jgi:hypothetical protein
LLLGGCGSAVPADDDAPTSALPLPHSSGGTIVLPRSTTGLPGTTFLPGAKPQVTSLAVPTTVACAGAASQTVTASFSTVNADRVAFVLDGRQLPGDAPTSGAFAITIPCDDRTHVLLVTAVSPDNQTAVDSRAITAGP